MRSAENKEGKRRQTGKKEAWTGKSDFVFSLQPWVYKAETMLWAKSETQTKD